jgi:hypothetical protein
VQIFEDCCLNVWSVWFVIDWQLLTNINVETARFDIRSAQSQFVHTDTCSAHLLHHDHQSTVVRDHFEILFCRYANSVLDLKSDNTGLDDGAIEIRLKHPDTALHAFRHGLIATAHGINDATASTPMAVAIQRSCKIGYVLPQGNFTCHHSA